MDPTVKALAEFLLKAVPTFVFLWLLTLYLKFVFFRPLEKVLAERARQTEGARKLAEEAFSLADKKTNEFEQALQAARTEIYREQDAMRTQLLAEQSEMVAKARAEAGAQIARARQEIAAETERAKAELTAISQQLADEIARNLLKRRAA